MTQPLSSSFLSIKVKRKHIKQGIIDCENQIFREAHCPIAQAFKDNLNFELRNWLTTHPYDLQVSFNYITLFHKDRIKRKWQISSRGIRWINNFDNHRPVKPQNFRFKQI